MKPSDKKTRSINVMVLFKNQMDVFQSFFLEAFYFSKLIFVKGKYLTQLRISWDSSAHEKRVKCSRLKNVVLGGMRNELGF